MTLFILVGNILQSRLQNETLEYTYDDLYQLVSENDHMYAYDALYNRLQKDTDVYAVNALNQLPSEFKYNADGNPYIHGSARFTYDALDRLTLIEDDTKKLQFTYDSYHRRASKAVYALENGEWQRLKTLFFLYDGQNEIGAIDNLGNLQELRILGRAPQAEIGSAIAIELQGKVFAPLHDLHGNVAMLVSLSDTAHEKYRYTAFGEEKDPQASSNPWRFSSKRLDEETHLAYFGRRYYLPSYGRWLTPDPLGLDAGPNLYLYVSNAPLTHVDLYGLFSSGDAKQSVIGSVHGVGEFGINTTSFLSKVGWGLSTPVRAVSWMTGRSSFSQDWGAFQRSNAAFHAAGDRWMHRVLPGDPNNKYYGMFRGGANDGLEIGTLFLGARTAYAMVDKTGTMIRGMQKITRPAGGGVSNFKKEVSRSNPLEGARYTSKVIKDMRLNPETARPDFHGFPSIVDNYAKFGRTESLIGRDGLKRTKITLPGGYQGREGCFEWILETDKTINHRLFVPNSYTIKK